MPRASRTAALHAPLGAMLLALALIVGTTLAVLAVSARASGSGSGLRSGSRSGLRSGSKSLVCSLDDREPLWPPQLRTGVRRTLVPTGAVGLTVCRYNGMNATPSTPQFGLLGIGVTDRSTIVKRLTRELDAIKPAHGVYSCPFDDDSEDVMTFGYASAPGVVVTVDTGGCNEITNGQVKRLGLGKPVVGQIAALVTPVKGLSWATVVGHIRLCGGPAPGRCWTSAYRNASSVDATNSSKMWAAMAQLHKGHLSFRLASPGRYMFELMGSGEQINTVVARTEATVTADRTTNIVFTIPVP
jgi:hypothetical protein